MSSKKARERAFHHEEFLTRCAEAKILHAQYGAHFRKQKEIALRLVTESKGDYELAVSKVKQKLAICQKKYQKTQLDWLRDRSHPDLIRAYDDARKSREESEFDLDALRDWWRREGKEEAEKLRTPEVAALEKDLKRKRVEMDEIEQKYKETQRRYEELKKVESELDAILSRRRDALLSIEKTEGELESAKKRVKRDE
jgi:hypothetical protein